jgi:uncharacterized membrane protein
MRFLFYTILVMIGIIISIPITVIIIAIEQARSNTDKIAEYFNSKL